MMTASVSLRKDSTVYNDQRSSDSDNTYDVKLFKRLKIGGPCSSALIRVSW